MTDESATELAVDEGDLSDDEQEGQIDECQLSSSPNDFNVLTITSFIENGALKIPGFQRRSVVCNITGGSYRMRTDRAHAEKVPQANGHRTPADEATPTG